MKRKLLFLIFNLILCVTACNAQNTLNILRKDGGVVSYGFSEKPVITCVGEDLHLSTTSVSVDYPMANVQRITFEDSPASVDEIRVDEDKSYQQEPSGLYIYNTNGLLLKKVNSVDGISSYNMQDLPSGIYIVKNGNTTFKVVKK